MINFALSLAFFALHNVLSRTLKLCGSENDTLRAVQRYFASHSHWWCLLVSAIETNISVLTFYSAVQLNAFSSFESLDRLSLLMGKAMLFLPFFYSFFVYTIIFAFYSKSKSKNVLGISKYSERGMILEMSVNCIFPFLSALAHGLFLDRPEIQVPSLILVNICELIAVFRFRDVFSFRFDMATMLVYKIGLFVFNVFILLFNFWEHSSIPFNFCFMVILAFLILVTLLKIVFDLGLTIYELCKVRSNRSAPEEAVSEFNGFKNTMKSINFQVTCKNIESSPYIKTKKVIPKQKTLKLKKQRMATLKNMLRKKTTINFMDSS